MTRVAYILVAVTACSAETPIPAESSHWSGQVFEAAPVPVPEAVSFAIESDEERGPYLSVGRWRAGSFGVRWETRARYPLLSGSVRGLYRTVDLLPGQAVVQVSFYQGSRRLEQRNTPLSNHADWTPFVVPIRRPPPNAETVVIGVGIGEKTEGFAHFSRITLSDKPLGVEFPDGYGELNRSKPPTDLTPGKAYRLAEHEGTWWLVSPAGRATFSLGVDPPSFTADTDGFEQGMRTLAAVRQLGFNSLAGWHNLFRWGALNDRLVSEGATPIAAFQVLSAGTQNGRHAVMTNAAGENAGDHAFPDPFDPVWESNLRASVAERAGRVKNRTWFAGWFAGNELAHRDLHRFLYSRYCAAAFREWLEEKYAAINLLNVAWGSRFESFEDLFITKPDPALRNGAMYEDFHAFSRMAIRRYNHTIIRVVREADPNHLIFSNRFMVGEVRDWIENLDLYSGFDGIAVNLYPTNVEPGLSHRERSILHEVHRRTGKPVIVTEWSVPAMDSGLYENWSKMDWSFPQAVDTQVERARQAARITAELYNLPFVIGAHWFIWSDYESSDRYANRGLFRRSGEPWTELQDTLRSVNGAINGIQ